MRAHLLPLLVLLSACGDKEATDSGEETDTDTDTDTDADYSCGDTPGMASERSTDSRVLALEDAALAFLDELDATQRLTAAACLDDAEWYSWTNIDVGDMPRTGGIAFSQLSAGQLDMLYAVFGAFLSEQGYTDVHDIINVIEPATAEKYADVENRTHGPEYYTVVFFGEPGVDPSWGIQLDGHHLAVHFLVHRDDVVVAPAFAGADPKVVGEVNPFSDEESTAYALIESLSADQLLVATISDTIFNDVFTSNQGFTDTDDGRDFDVTAFASEGIAASALDASQQALLRAAIAAHIGDLEDDLAAAWSASIEASFDEVRFAWVGDPTEGAAMYYRIYHPTFLVEYVHSNSMVDHPHAIVRRPNASAEDDVLSDYGVFADVIEADPLRDHLRSHPHHLADRIEHTHLSADDAVVMDHHHHDHRAHN